MISATSFGSPDDLPVRALREKGIEVVFNPYGRSLRPEESVQLLQGCVGLIAGTEALSEGVLVQAKELRAISRCGVGVDNVDFDAALRLGISVRCTPEAPINAVAELTLALTLDLLRMIPEADRNVRSGKWLKPMGKLLKGKAVGIVGLGRIGKRVGQLLQPFDCRLLAYDVLPDNDWASHHRAEFLSFYELLAMSDIVSLHIPYSSAVHHLIGELELRHMKRGAMLINTARGGLIDEDALRRALEQGHLGGVALDVYEYEPYRGPLGSLPTVILTPHIGSYAVEARSAMERQAVENLLGMLEIK